MYFSFANVQGEFLSFKFFSSKGLGVCRYVSVFDHKSSLVVSTPLNCGASAPHQAKINSLFE